MIRWGLCCAWVEEPIRFRTATATALLRLSADERLARLGELATANAAALAASLRACRARGIGSFRLGSGVLPLATHPVLGYALDDLPGGAAARLAFARCEELARQLGVRLTLHPDQFVVLGSPRPEVVASSLAELEHQAQVAEWIGADVITLHGGGGYGDPAAALGRLEAAVGRLSARARARLALENDDRVFTPQALLPVCRRLRLPLVYDVHHHRCLPDTLSIDEATAEALATWDREPVFHLSSPREGWTGRDPRRHHDFVDLADLPRGWLAMELTVEVEAKAKELAVARAMAQSVAVAQRGSPARRRPRAKLNAPAPAPVVRGSGRRPEAG